MQDRALSLMFLVALTAGAARPQDLKNPCEVIAAADVAAATGLTVNRFSQAQYSPGQLAGYKTFHECHFYDSRSEPQWAEVNMKFTGAIVMLQVYKSANPDAYANAAKFNRLLNADGSLRADRNVEGLGDAALWESGGQCQLGVFSGPSTIPGWSGQHGVGPSPSDDRAARHSRYYHDLGRWPVCFRRTILMEFPRPGKCSMRTERRLSSCKKRLKICTTLPILWPTLLLKARLNRMSVLRRFSIVLFACNSLRTNMPKRDR